jgi:hypothetical protein
VPLALQRKLSHLAVFARGLLPAEDAAPALLPAVDTLLADESYDGSRPTLPLASIRTTILSQDLASVIANTWMENQGIPAYKFSIGDLGYVPAGKKLGNGFIKLCNVVEDGLVKFELVQEAYATKYDSADTRAEEIQGFPMGPNIMG